MCHLLRLGLSTFKHIKKKKHHYSSLPFPNISRSPRGAPSPGHECLWLRLVPEPRSQDGDGWRFGWQIGVSRFPSHDPSIPSIKSKNQMFTEVNRFRLFQRVRNIYPVHFVHVRPLLRYRSDRLLCWAGTKRSCNQSVGPTSLLRWKRGKKLHLHQLLIFQFYRSTFTTVHQPCFQLPPTMKNCSSWKG